MPEPTIAELETTADRLTGRGISGLTPEDWPVLVAALEDYITIRRHVDDWNNKVARVVQQQGDWK